MRDVIQSLWIGTALSVLEQLSITSFLRHGHPYHLYVYQEVQNVPAGVVLCDGNAILPASMIFQYRTYQTYAGFSNFFRYKLLLDKGGWWADTDLVCLQPFTFPEAIVFSTEQYQEQMLVNCGAIKVPAGSAVMAYAWTVCQTKNVQHLAWGEVGPRLLAEAVQHCTLTAYVQPYQVFCPLGYAQWRQVLEPGLDWQFDARTCAIHLWNEMWRRNATDKNARYAPRCLYEQLKARYLCA